MNDEFISLQGSDIIAVKDVMQSDSKTIKPLFDTLKKLSLENTEISDNRAVTIMADKQIPYALLKKIMLTCAGAEFTNLSFAVNQKAGAGES